MIVVIYSPNGNCVEVKDITSILLLLYGDRFPLQLGYYANGFCTYTMYLPTNYLSGDGTWYFTVQNGWTNANNTNYDLDIILNGICEQGGATTLGL